MGKAVSNMDLSAEGILHEFEGEPVTATGVSVDNAAGAVNAIMEAEPTVMAKGHSGFLVFRYDVTGVTFKGVKNDEGNDIRVHAIRLTDAAFMDSSTTVEREINRARAKRHAVELLNNGQGTLVSDERE